jgi:hypothetical protein
MASVKVSSVAKALSGDGTAFVAAAKGSAEIIVPLLRANRFEE